MGGSAPDVVESVVGGARVVRIAGEINEKFDPRSIAHGPAAAIVVFDLEGLVRISSYGLSQWVLALEGLGADYYCFVRVQPPIVDQFNMVRTFGGRGELVTFYAPFRCPACDEVVNLLIDLRHDFARLEMLDFERVWCPRCGGAAELDELPDLYFRHVRSMPPPQPPAAAAAAIDGKPVAGAPSFHIEKEVAGGVTSFRLTGVIEEPRSFRRKADGVDGLVVVDLAGVSGASASGLDGLAGFLRALGQDAFLARVPAPLIEPVALMFERHRLEATVAVASVVVPLRCPACDRDARVEMEGDEALALAAGAPPGRACPRCGTALDAAAARPVLEAGRRLPFDAPPEPIERSLRAHAGGAGEDSLAAVLANPRNLLLGRYQVLGVLGEGGMGEIFLVRQLGPEGFSKKLVLKRVKRSRIDDAHSSDMLLEEARIAAQLSHPNVVQAVGLERIGTEYFMVMEYVEGIDLARALALSAEADIVWPVQVACRVVAAICAGLHAAHTWIDEQGRPAPIVHRDVSPDNVLVSAKGEVKVADFGIASVGRGSDGETFRGKVGYAAPELFLGAPPRPAADVYAAGAILFELLARTRFRPGDRRQAAARAALPPPRLAPLRADVPAQLELVYLRAVEPAPARRYARADDLARDLEIVLQELEDRSQTDYVAFLARLVALSLPRHTTMTAGRSERLQWTEPVGAEAATVAEPARARRPRPT
ncbi:MAG TPA: serine/threonine-protein kinase [Kofleriaceae bacterium]|nr:serine/threonine-protein kinase [Kofleriaceae bacterium]